MHYQIVVNWRPFGLWWKAIGGVLCATLAVWSTVVVFDASVAWALSYVGPHTSIPLHLAMALLGFGTFIGTVVLAVITVLFLIFSPSDDMKKKPEQSEEAYRVFLATTAREMFTIAACLNPVGLMVLSIIYLPTGTRYVVNNAPRWTRNTGEFGLVSLMAIANFVRYTFVYVHSERRTLCFVDATLGAAIGYAFGSAIIGMIAGIVAGVINYEIISKRVLRIVPA